VQAHCERWPDFGETYGQLANIHRKFGIEPIKILTMYSMNWNEVEPFVNWEEMPVLQLNEEIGRSRLDQCLEVVNSIRLPEVHHWTKDDWLQFFYHRVINFPRWLSGRQEVDSFFAYDLSLCQEWWEDRGFEGPYNPAEAVEWIQSVPQELVGRTVHSVQPADTTNAQQQQRLRGIDERVKLAREQDRSVVALSSPANTILIGFVPRFDKDNQAAMPFTCLMTGKKPHIAPQERDVYEVTLRESLSTLLFFEGLRMMISTGYGVRCPVRCMEWSGQAFARIEGTQLPSCCGRAKGIMAFWEAGNKAKKSGWFQHLRWESPYECM
jgi:hypothetical protein